ncbi:MAG: hypothetical protein WCT24_01975 [Patescibacteria group bacterium]
MQKEKMLIKVLFAVTLLIVGGIIFLKSDYGVRLVRGVPTGNELGQMNGISFYYPLDTYAFYKGGFYDRAFFIEHQVEIERGTLVSDMQPVIRLSSSKKSDQTVEEDALDGIPMEWFADFPEDYAYGHKIIGGRDVVWVRQSEMMDIAQYFFAEENQLFIFQSLASEPDVLTQVEAIIATVK